MSDSLGNLTLVSEGSPSVPEAWRRAVRKGCDDGSAQEETALAHWLTRHSESSGGRPPPRQALRGDRPVYRCQESPRLLHV